MSVARHRLVVAGISVLAATMAAGGCTSGSGGAAASPSRTSATATTVSPAPTAVGGATPTLSDPAEEGDEPSPLASPVPDVESNRDAVDLAVRTMAAFGRTGLSAQAWWAQLSPALSEIARSAYEGTDPANVPVHAVTGPGRLLPSSSGFLAKVSVPTDVGVFTVLLSRPGQNAPWAVERLTFPKGVH